MLLFGSLEAGGTKMACAIGISAFGPVGPGAYMEKGGQL